MLLAICAGGLRRFLANREQLPERPLIAFIPVNVRPKESEGGGNAVGAALVSLATDIEDPLARLATITASARAAKDRMRGMSADAVMAYSALLLAPAGLQVARAVSGLPLPVPTTLNVCISNVRGPKETLYWRGARLEATYPVSIPGHSMALNIAARLHAGRPRHRLRGRPRVAAAPPAPRGAHRRGAGQARGGGVSRAGGQP